MKSKILEKDIKPKVQKKKKKKSKYYVDPVKFKELIIEYYESDDFTEELGHMVNDISNHVAFMPNFIQYTYRDEMISDSNYKMVKALNQKKYDPTKGNPFSYFTKICCRCFINVIKKEKRVNETITKYQDEMFNELTLQGLHSSCMADDDNVDHEYE